MKTIADQYKLVTEGKLGQFQFMRNVRLTFPQFVTNVTSFGDAVKILKNKGVISEAKVEEHYDCDPQQYDLGMRYELSKGTDELKADKIVTKNLKSNRAYYTNLGTAQNAGTTVRVEQPTLQTQQVIANRAETLCGVCTSNVYTFPPTNSAFN